MIELKNIYLEKFDNKIYLKSDCIVNSELQILWYSTAIENEDYISTSNADSFLLVLFVYSVFNNLKLKSNVAISSELHYGLLEVLLPTFHQMGFHSKKSDFSFSEIDYTTYPDAQGIGTAMSFGVDSMYAYLDSFNHHKKVNILTLFNAGAFGHDGGDEARKLFEKMKFKVEKFAKETHQQFVWIDTNLNRILQMSFYQTSVFRNFACVFVLQKKFKDYLYGSGDTLADFRLELNDTSYYDLLSSKAIRGNTLNFHISGLNTHRLQKTIAISDEPLAKKYLNVCLIVPENEELEGTENCSKCFKCIPTMQSLDAIGKLEEFSDVFSLEIYNADKLKNLGKLIYRVWRLNDVDDVVILNEMKIRKYRIPPKAYWFLFLRALKTVTNILSLSNDNGET